MPPQPHVIERRIFGTEFRDVAGSNGRQKWATAVTYNTVDDYGTLWLPSCFDEGLRERMPTILYGHDWYSLEHVLGQGTDFRQTPGDVGPPGVDVLIEFADPEQIEAARTAIVLTSGDKPILKDVSVGFDRREWLRRDELTPEQLAAGAEEAMVRAAMDELSIVVRGAVPGAQLRGKRSWLVDGRVTTKMPTASRKVRMGVQTVNLDDVIEVAKRKAAGELTAEEARTTLELLATEEPDAPAADVVEDAPAAEAETPAVDADADEVAPDAEVEVEVDAAAGDAGAETLSDADLDALINTGTFLGRA
jgi:hypothetical protein